MTLFNDKNDFSPKVEFEYIAMAPPHYEGYKFRKGI
jgi:hypothetical protein